MGLLKYELKFSSSLHSNISSMQLSHVTSGCHTGQHRIRVFPSSEQVLLDSVLDNPIAERYYSVTLLRLFALSFIPYF